MNRERSEHSSSRARACVFVHVCAYVRVCKVQVWDASVHPDPAMSIFTQYSEI